MVLATSLGGSLALSPAGVRKSCWECINSSAKALRARLGEWAALWAARCYLVRCLARFFRILATVLFGFPRPPHFCPPFLIPPQYAVLELSSVVKKPAKPKLKAPQVAELFD